jgi:hypothetical protein
MNRFRDPTMRREYDAAVRAWEIKHKDLFRRDAQFVGSSFADAFWAGFNDAPQVGRNNYKDAESRKMICYAYFRAGRDCAIKKATD